MVDISDGERCGIARCGTAGSDCKHDRGVCGSDPVVTDADVVGVVVASALCVEIG